MAAKKIKKLDDLTPQRLNANAGTQRGRGMLERSMGEVGFLGAMTAAADGEVFAGSKRLEVAGEVFADVEPIIVESDGTRPIVVVRTDVPNADDPRAVRAGILDNRVAQVSLDFDVDVLRMLADEQPEALAGMWTDAELSFLMGAPQPGDDDTLSGDAQLGGYEYRVIVACDSEAHQAETIATLESMGLVCQALIS